MVSIWYLESDQQTVINRNHLIIDRNKEISSLEFMIIYHPLTNPNPHFTLLMRLILFTPD